MNKYTSSIIYDIMQNPNKFIVDTPQMKELSETIHKWHLNGFTGGIVIGANRIGKTFAINKIKDDIKGRNGKKISAHYASIAQRDIGTIAGVLRIIAYSVGLKIKSTTPADIIANDLIHYIGESATSSENPHSSILFVDELQRIRPKQFEVFAELFDGLNNFDIQLTTIFIGNSIATDQLLEKMEEEPQYELIRGRFFLNMYEYFGIRKYDELKSCLKFIDENYLFTKGNSYIDDFLSGHNIQKDWRLVDIADNIWSVYQNEFHKKQKIESWGMQYFRSMIITLLFDFFPSQEFNDPIILEQMIEASINASGLVPDQIRLIK